MLVTQKDKNPEVPEGVEGPHLEELINGMSQEFSAKLDGLIDKIDKSFQTLPKSITDVITLGI